MGLLGNFRASLTLRADLVSALMCRLLNHMDAIGAGVVVPVLRPEDEHMALRPWVDTENFNPGYMASSLALLPRQGSDRFWPRTAVRSSQRMKAPLGTLTVRISIVPPIAEVRTAPRKTAAAGQRAQDSKTQ